MTLEPRTCSVCRKPLGVIAFAFKSGARECRECYEATEAEMNRQNTAGTVVQATLGPGAKRTKREARA